MDKKVKELKAKYFDLMDKKVVEEAIKVGKEYLDYFENIENPVFDKDDIVIAWDLGYSKGFQEGYDICWEDNVQK